LFWVEEIPVRAILDLVDDIGFEIDVDASWDVLALALLLVVSQVFKTRTCF
jgi:hypothetical protein